jgi:cytochrome c
MEFLDKFILPQSAHHMVLIKYLLVLTHILFVSYISVLLGSLIYTIYFKRRFDQTGDPILYEFSKDLIDLATFNKGIAFAFGFVPLLSAMFGYLQLLHGTSINVADYFFVSMIFLLAALILIFTFKYSIHLKDIFLVAETGRTENERSKEDIENYKSSTSVLYKRTGMYGLICLIISIYWYTSAVQVATDISRWNQDKGILYFIFSLNTLASFLQTVSVSLTLTSLVVLYKFFRANREIKLIDEKYLSFVKNFSLKSAALYSLIVPVAIVLATFSKPVPSLSFDFFGITVLAMLLVLLISSLVYIMMKENSVKYVSVTIFLFVIVFGILVLRDQYSFDTATQAHYAYLSDEYDIYEAGLKEKYGISKVVINGADIYNTKCIACHNFDKKIVGPSHNSVLPKYEGKKEALVKYILSPVKVDPSYPAMPQQGLKPNEAEAVADYMLATYKKK